MKKLLASIAATGAATLMFVAPASAAGGETTYTAQLNELNNSGGNGTATVTVAEDGKTMTVAIKASNLNLDGPHAQHIHAIVDGMSVSQSACPTSANDTDGDGVIDTVEGGPAYGAVKVSLTTEGDSTDASALAVDRFLTGTSFNYSRSGIPVPEALQSNLGKTAIVVHGLDENGNGVVDADQKERSSLDPSLPREATAPALCGTLAAQAGGPIDTGAGGLAENGNGGLIGGGLALLAGAGFATVAIRTRRRTV